MHGTTNSIFSIRTFNKLVAIIVVLTIMVFLFLSPPKKVKADAFTDEIDKMLDEIDLSELEQFFDKLGEGGFSIKVKDILSGNFNTDYSNFFNYLLEVLFSKVKSLIPIFTTILAICIFSILLNGNKSSLGELKGVVSTVCFFAISLVLILQTGKVINEVKEIIGSLRNFVSIISPILLTLMVASGGNVSATLYKPTVAFLSNGITEIILSIVLPLVMAIFIFNVISSFIENTRFNRTIELVSSIIKWVLGISFTVFTVFLSIQGIGASSIDGISLRVTKYTISNSVPIIGGFISGGFDIVVAGSALIKNAVGIGGLIFTFYLLISPLIYILAFSLILKFIGAILEPLSSLKFTNFFFGLSKTLELLLACIIGVFFMVFISIVLMICSANAIVL
ncbi:MAG: stage III sporulation protein AE [Clostridia bacterium]|nr:stage III sporulation protein AE [Clostridia bacterium]